jgi:GT2 family glycosyltransferase
MTDDGISVIVPTHEHWTLTRRTLEAIALDCELAGGEWEVIVIDNESGPEFIGQLRAFAGRTGRVRLIQRAGLDGFPFQPGAARNAGIEAANYDCLVFLDADCIPSTSLITAYRSRVRLGHRTVYLGYRVFVDATELDPVEVAAERGLLDAAPMVASVSNYGLAVDRRMEELLSLDSHPLPWDCMYVCNMAVHRDCLGDHRFNRVFDGYWGYEDIELGYRLHRAGLTFSFVPEAFAYHQENLSLSPQDRLEGRARNFAIAGRLIPGFIEYRNSIRRAGAVPDSFRTADARSRSLADPRTENQCISPS